MTENPKLFGEWKSYKSDNFDAVLEKMGMNPVKRKMAATANPVFIAERIDDRHIKATFKVPVFENTVVFTLGEPTPMKLPEGDTIQIAEWEDGKLKIYIGDKDNDPRSTGRLQYREILDDGDMLVTINCEGVVAKRWFKRVK